MAEFSVDRFTSFQSQTLDRGVVQYRSEILHNSEQCVVSCDVTDIGLMHHVAEKLELTLIYRSITRPARKWKLSADRFCPTVFRLKDVIYQQSNYNVAEQETKSVFSFVCSARSAPVNVGHCWKYKHVTTVGVKGQAVNSPRCLSRGFFFFLLSLPSPPYTVL